MDQVSLFILENNKKCYYGLAPRAGRSDVLRRKLRIGLINYSSKYDEKALKFDFILLKDKIDLKPTLIKRIWNMRKQVLVDLSSINLSPQTLAKLRALIRRRIKLTFVFTNPIVFTEGLQILNHVHSRLSIPIVEHFDKLYEDV